MQRQSLQPLSLLLFILLYLFLLFQQQAFADVIIISPPGIDGDVNGTPGNDTITIQSGATVGADIEANFGDDIVRLEVGPNNIGGDIRGGTGTSDTDILIFSGGTWTQGNAKIGEFELNQVDATKDLTLNGSWDIGTEAATVNGGTLRVNNSLTAGRLDVNSGNAIINGTVQAPLVEIEAAGTLSGNATIIGDVTNRGTISPGNSIGTINIQGDLTVESGSTYIVEIGRNGRSDRINVTGRAALNGGTVRARIPRRLYIDGEKWTILRADGGISGRFSRLSGTPSSATLNFSLAYSSNDVRLVVIRTPYASFGKTENARVIGAALDQAVPREAGTGSDLERYLIMLDYEYSGDQICDSLDQINPEPYAAYTETATVITQQFARDIGSRIDERRLQLDGSQNTWTFWGFGSGSRTSIGSGASGYEINTGNVTVGGDNQTLPWLLIGFGAGFNSSTLEYSTDSTDSDQKSAISALYGKVNVNEAFSLNTILGYGYYDNDAQRSDPLSNSQISADFSGQSYLGQLGINYDFDLDGWIVGPVAELTYMRVIRGSFTEKGSSMFPLHVEEAVDNRLSERLFFRATKKFEGEHHTIIPRFTLGVQHAEYDVSEVEASFIGSSDSIFTVKGAEIPQYLFGTELGFTAHLFKKIGVYAKLTGNIGEDYDQYSLRVGFDGQF